MSASREILTDKKVRNLPAAPTGKRVEIADAIVPGMYLRITDKGAKSFVLVARFPGGNNQTRRTIGEYGAVTLEEARETAREWIALIKRGVDPKEEQERAKAVEQRKRDLTFAVVVQDFITDKLSRERRGAAVEADLRNSFIPAWGRRPITEITEIDVLTLVNAKKRTAPMQAYILLKLAKRMFQWMVDQRVYGLKDNPADKLKPKKIIGELTPRQRVLSPVEMFALWRAAGHMRFPYGAIYRMLALTALRLNEVADAQWQEFDLPNRLWTIPAKRMKGTDAKPRPHAVPLTDDMLEVLAELPPGKGKQFVFSAKRDATTGPWMATRIKTELERRMVATLKALARKQGDDPADVVVEPFVNHDIRRTVRSNLSRLRIPEVASEAIMAHARPGIRGVYDVHDYLDEKREALEMWGARLRSFMEPAAPSNVLPMPKRARA